MSTYVLMKILTINLMYYCRFNNKYIDITKHDTNSTYNKIKILTYMCILLIHPFKSTQSKHFFYVLVIKMMSHKVYMFSFFWVGKNLYL